MCQPLLSAIEAIAEDGGVIESGHDLMIDAALLAEDHKISVYDAAYFAAARATNRILVSCDVHDLVSKGLARLPGGDFGDSSSRPGLQA